MMSLKDYSFFSSGCHFALRKKCSTKLSTKFILLINVKIPTIFGILTFISMIHSSCKKLLSLSVFYFYEQLKFRAQLSMKKV